MSRSSTAHCVITPGSARLRADEDRQRVQRRVARDADGRLELGEAARGRLGGVGGEQRRVLLQVRDVRLVGRRMPRAQLLQREHQLDRVEHPDHAREPRGRQAAREADELGPRDVDVDESARDLRRRRAAAASAATSRSSRARQEVVEHVPLGRAAPVQLDDASVLDDERRRRVVRAVERDETQLGERLDQDLAAQVALGARREPCGAAQARRPRAA